MQKGCRSVFLIISSLDLDLFKNNPGGFFFIALPGDTITYNKSDLLIKEGHFWLEGDAKKASVDSRHYGQVPIGLLEGKVVLSLLPLKLKIS